MQQQLLAPTDSHQQPEAVSDLIEITLPGDVRSHLPLILPLVSQLTYDSGPGWLTYVGSALLSKKDCRQFGLNWQRLLQVLPSSRCCDTLEIAVRALLGGRSHTVVVVAKACGPQQLQRLDEAAKKGECRCIVIHAR